MIFEDRLLVWDGPRWRAAWKAREEELRQFVNAVAARLMDDGDRHRAEKLLACAEERILVDPGEPERAQIVRSSCNCRLCPSCYFRERLATVMPLVGWIHARLRRGAFAYLFTVTCKHAPGVTPRAQRVLLQEGVTRLWRSTVVKEGVVGWIKKFEGHRDESGTGWNEHVHVLIIGRRLKYAQLRDAFRRAVRDAKAVIDIDPVPASDVGKVLAYLGKPSLDTVDEYVRRGRSLHGRRDVTFGGPALRKHRREALARRHAPRRRSGTTSERLDLSRPQLAGLAEAGAPWAVAATRVIDEARSRDEARQAAARLRRQQQQASRGRGEAPSMTGSARPKPRSDRKRRR